MVYHASVSVTGPLTLTGNEVVKLEDSDLVAASTPMVRAVVPGIMAAFGALLRGRQDRKNLEADHAVVDRIIQAGQTNFRYRGVAMELETFADERQKETERLVTNTVNAAAKADSVVDWSKVDLSQFSPEFRSRWVSEASNVSDETLQDLWARLLAGELESPGSVSNDTMSIARDLNKDRAGEFQTLCSAALCHWDRTPMIVVGCGNPGSNSLRPYGLSYEVLMLLAHHRLIINEMSSYRGFAVGPSLPGIQVRQQESAWLLSWARDTKPNDEAYRIKGILFTPAGKELFKVVQKTPNPAYTTAMLKTLEQDGWTTVPIHS